MFNVNNHNKRKECEQVRRPYFIMMIPIEGV